MRGVTSVLATALFWSGALATQAQEAGKLSVTLTNVSGAGGKVSALLCADPATFMQSCMTYRASAPAVAGETIVTFESVKPGAYAFSAMHDANGNNRLDFPAEGYAFGNDAGYPPSFESSAIKVSGATTARVKMTYIGGPAVAPAAQSSEPYTTQPVKTVVDEKGLKGEFYAPENARGRVPALIVMSGSDGMLETARVLGRRFADHGYAVLVLPFWRVAGLKPTLQEIPLEYFDTAVDWLRSRPEVDTGRIGVLGWSKGAEAALLLAAGNRHVRALVGVAPTFATWPGIDFADPTTSKSSWTRGGAPLDFLPLTMIPGTSYETIYKNALAQVGAHPDAVIKVERINGPILLLSGANDKLWPAADMGGRVLARLREKNFKYEATQKVYEGAGHAVFIGGLTDTSGSFTSLQSMFGGTSAANSAAWKDSWPRTLAFFDKALKGRTP